MSAIFIPHLVAKCWCLRNPATAIMLFTQEPSAAYGHFQECRGQCLFDYSCVGVGGVSTRGFVDSLQLPVTCKHVAPGPG